MLILRAFVAAAAILLSAGSTVPAPIVEENSPVVRVNDHCSGFYLGDGYVATAAHCITDLNKQFVRFEGVEKEIYGSLLYYSRSRMGGDDLAVIKISSVDQPRMQLACDGPPATGSEVHMTGWPGDYGRATVWGRVADQPREYPNWWRSILPVDITSYGGFSGSAVLDHRERVVGVMVGALTKQMSLALVAPVRRLCEFLKQ